MRPGDGAEQTRVRRNLKTRKERERKTNEPTAEMEKKGREGTVMASASTMRGTSPKDMVTNLFRCVSDLKSYGALDLDPTVFFFVCL